MKTSLRSDDFYSVGAVQEIKSEQYIISWVGIAWIEPESCFLYLMRWSRCSSIFLIQKGCVGGCAKI